LLDQKFIVFLLRRKENLERALAENGGQRTEAFVVVAGGANFVAYLPLLSGTLSE
jgi:hypothetical protein